jgi:hypothetical protein
MLPGVVSLLEPAIHRTDTYRWARGATTPNAERAALVERVTGGKVPANAWTPDDKGEDGPIAKPVEITDDAPVSSSSPATEKGSAA